MIPYIKADNDTILNEKLYYGYNEWLIVWRYVLKEMDVN